MKNSGFNRHEIFEMCVGILEFFNNHHPDIARILAAVLQGFGILHFLLFIQVAEPELLSNLLCVFVSVCVRAGVNIPAGMPKGRPEDSLHGALRVELLTIWVQGIKLVVYSCVFLGLGGPHKAVWKQGHLQHRFQTC